MVEPSQVGEARRIAAALAGALGFSEVERGRVALVVTEAGNNLVRHATGGELLLRSLRDDPGALEVLALDSGPGMADVSRCLQDGYSTGGTPGKGLGAISRLSDLFDLHSSPQIGSALLARIGRDRSAAATGDGWLSGDAARAPRMEVGIVCQPHPGEEVCGDAWTVEQETGRTLFMIADGLGHGATAADASREAVRIFRAESARAPGEILQRAHAALRHTRGAAMAIAELRHDAGEVRYAGIGNIGAVLVAPGGEVAHLVSHNGTVGHQVRKVQEFVYPWPQNGTLVMHSDGLSTQWRLDRCPGLASRHPGVIAGVLYRDFKRGRDDVTVLVTRVSAPTARP